MGGLEPPNLEANTSQFWWKYTSNNDGCNTPGGISPTILVLNTIHPITTKSGCIILPPDQCFYSVYMCVCMCVFTLILCVGMCVGACGCICVH